MTQKKPKKVLITGANGFIGNTLMRYYKANNVPVVGVDLVGNGDDIVKGDIAQPDPIYFQRWRWPMSRAVTTAKI